MRRDSFHTSQGHGHGRGSTLHEVLRETTNLPSWVVYPWLSVLILLTAQVCSMLLTVFCLPVYNGARLLVRRLHPCGIRVPGHGEPLHQST